MTVEISHLAPADVDDVLEAQLLELTLKTGEMAKVYRTCKNPQRRHWQGHVIIARIDGAIVGWALRWTCFPGHGVWSVHLYVHRAHRRNGIGTALVSAARYRLRRHTELRGHPWNTGSTEFWQHITRTVPATSIPSLTTRTSA